MNRNSSFFWLTDTSENADGDDPGGDDYDEGLLQETGLSIDEDHFVEGTASSNTALQFQRHEHVLPPRPTFLPPPAFVGNEQEEAQPLLAGTKSYGSQDRPLFALSENSPVERTPPILQRRMLATSVNNKINDNTNPTTMPRQNIQPLRFQVV